MMRGMVRHPLLRDVARDFGLAVRLLFRRRGFTAIVLLTLALGTGTPAAIFSVVNAVLLQPLPFAEPDRVVQFRLEGGRAGSPVSIDAIPAEMALQWQQETSTLDAIALLNEQSLTLSSSAGPFRLTGAAVSANLFELLGVRAAVGSTFERQSRDARQVVLSHETWHRHFGASGSVVGSTVTLNGEPYGVLGVMPARFDFPSPDAAFWVPLVIQQGGGRGMLLRAIGRLRPGVTIDDAVREGRTLLAPMEAGPHSHVLFARTLQDQMVGGARRVLWVFMAAVGVVFVVAVVNIALLLLTRGAGRDLEFSIRIAIGAGRGHLFRQLLIEGLLLATLGGAAGLLLANGMLRVLLAMAPASIPRLQDAAIDGRVLAFSGLLIVITTLLFGLLSAARAMTIAPASSLARAGGDSHSTRTRAGRWRLNALVISELAATSVLLVAAGLLLRTFVGLVLVDQGYAPGGAVAFQINLPAARYPSPGARLAFHERALERLRALPGIERLGLTTSMPTRQPSARMEFSPVPVSGAPDPINTPIVETRTVSEGFFAAMGIPLLAGRDFSAEDELAADPVIIVSESYVRRYFPGRGALGEIVYSRIGGDRRIVGIVGDVRPAATGAEPVPAAYLALRQDVGVFRWFATVTVVARGSAELTPLQPALRAAVLALDPDMPAFNMRPLRADVAAVVAGPQFVAAVLTGFALVAVILAAGGVYGVIAYSVAQRTREIGVRSALGATRRQILALVLRDGVGVVAAGVGAGLVASLWLARGLTGLLHQVSPADPLALALVAAVLSFVGLLAAFVPARRATRVSALDALREV